MEKNGSVMKEREISLIDLIVEMLLHWRAFFVVMLIGGILFAALGYVRSSRAAAAQNAQQQFPANEEADADENPDKNWLEELTEGQLNNINNVIMYEKLYEKKLLYQQESVLMQVDPFNVARAEITFLITSDDMEKTYNIEKVYEDLLSSTELYDYVAKNCDVSGNINELISLEKTSYGMMQGSDTVRLAVIYSDEEGCKQIADAVAAYIGEKQEWLTTALGEHKVVLLNSSTGIVMNKDILGKQYDSTVELANIRNQIIASKAAFSDEEWHYYNLQTNGKATGNPDADKIQSEEKESEDDKSTVTVPVKKGISIKYVLLGMLVFLFVYAFFVFIVYILNNKLRITDKLQEMFGIPQLGTIVVNRKKKKFLGIIDQWILKLRYRGQRKFTEVEALRFATAAVKMNAKKMELNQVHFIGCNMSEPLLLTCKQMKDNLEKENIKVEILNNIIYDVEAMEDLENVSAVVLVETVGSTLYDEIVKELELLNSQNVKVLGGIVAE